jgi:uroporphyrinogen III methyltransferase/synthase
VPEEYRAEGVIRALDRLAGRGGIRGARVLIPRAAVARDLLPRALAARGARVEVAPVYRTRPSREGAGAAAAALRRGEVDLITFTSSSTVTGFARKFRDRRLLRGRAAAVIGPITAATARRHGFRVRVMPRDYTLPALGEAIVRAFRNSPSGTLRAW